MVSSHREEIIDTGVQVAVIVPGLNEKAVSYLLPRKVAVAALDSYEINPAEEAACFAGGKQGHPCP